MITASQIMTTELITLTPETEITRAAEILLSNRINGAPVVDERGRLVGILCQSDLVAQQKNIPVPTVFSLLEGYIQLSSRKIEKQVRKIAALTVAEAMTPDPVSVRPDTGIDAVAALMVDNSFHTLPVVDENKLVGIVGKEDVLKTLINPDTL
ncbi:CBS domain protein sometimes clustered with YjeE [Olavius algarvensis associated proteobacterium Delta 3]|nr:CBS domain protein sometimes clustered with YjeE [Olavius algarvensis associated proteobacterium Delta 3]CAB5130970.1 CBS domain protein sometimes clustered with YjeE [Olavius algarvensis associated proteobacterium Delta 3]